MLNTSYPNREDTPALEVMDPATRRKLKIERQIEHTYALQNEMEHMMNIVGELREAFEELAEEGRSQYVIHVGP